MRRYLVGLLLAVMLLLQAVPALAAGTNLPAETRNQMIALASDALIGAGGKDWSHVSAVIGQLKPLWTSAAAADTSDEAKAVTAAFAKAEQELAKPQKDNAAAYEAVSALVKALDGYVSAGDGDAAKEKAHKQVQTALVPQLQKSLIAVQAGDIAQAKTAFAAFNGGWSKAESLIRQDNAKVYGAIEVKISGARIALNTEPADAAKAAAKLQELIAALQDYAAGGTAAGAADAPADSIRTIGGLLQLLDAASADVQSRRAADAAAKMDRFVAVWPALEGEVATRSPQAYERIEAKMVAVPILLLSNPPAFEQASAALGELRKELEPYAEAASYTAWDAGVILFREGLEAILIIAALVSFLNRSGNADKRKWIWSGAGAGIAVSGLMAVVLSMLLSQLSTGSSRELIEGITGLVAVGFMVSIGAWLHRKSNLRAWNAFVEKTIGESLSKGALWSLFAAAFLSVMREGAETLIFYIGMAQAISTADMLLGVGTALLLLAVIGFLIIRMSKRIPVRPFFLMASLLLYYLAFKFIGVSIHALQVTGHVAAHTPGYLPDISLLGMYGSWETTGAQLVVLAVILWNVIRAERKTQVSWTRKTA
ncbi:FTR1 family iron permease [Paenibacillus hamazuiensis]|uniref:FTR1 family iron permease n=1 Tax=Paenibacillus hamazuiensis TaxID=2936508 RepID=UPI00200E88D1|nr:FTR1 family protein [Paenibacillus hamazuiensis]